MATSKRAGKKSLAQNDFLAPQTPINVSATDVGTNREFNNGAADVSFSLPANSPAATSYTVTAYYDGQNPEKTVNGNSSPIRVSGLSSAALYKFSVIATNASGSSAESDTSGGVTITTVPATPSAPSVSSPSAGIDRISWSAPANGGKTITNYYWQSDDGKSGNTTSTTVDVNQEQGSSQTYTVRADNANGSSTTSAASQSVTTTFSFAPFGAFGFSPFGFSPFGFSPFGFSPFGFTPYWYGG